MRLKQLVVAGLFVLALGCVLVMDITSAKPQAAGSQAARDDGSLKAVITNLDRRDFHLTLSVRVAGRDDNVVGGLEQKDFAVSEDGQDSPVKRFLSAGQQPLRACLVIDQSGSMAGKKLDGAKEAALAYLDLQRDGIDQMGLIFFESSIREIVPVSTVTTGTRARARAAVRELEVLGGTLMYQAMEKALETMKAVTGRRLLLVMTDGKDDKSDKDQRRRIIARAKELSVPLFMVGLGESKEIDEPAMREFADGSGGRYLRTPRPEKLKEIYQEIGRSLQNEYVIEYDSPYPVENGLTRRVTVSVRHGDTGTRAESEYKVAGVLGAGGRRPTDGGPARQEAPFASVFWPLLLGLALLFGVPYALQRRDRAESPAPAPQRPPAPAPIAAPMKPAAPVSAADTCPYCKQYRAPGTPGQRFCMVCERTY